MALHSSKIVPQEGSADVASRVPFTLAFSIRKRRLECCSLAPQQFGRVVVGPPMIKTLQSF
jgi:hypothetical protein